MRMKIAAMVMLGLSACGQGAKNGSATTNAQRAPAAPASNRVAASGKVDVPLAEVPAEVLAAARAARPGFVPAEAESETRDGRLYYDVEGRLPDGTEIEFDIMQADGRWRVVETQRDLAFAAVPGPVRAAALARDAALAPTRVIESVQADGLVIFEIYQGERKLEVRWDGRQATVLDREWAH
ncbi:MAG TPA: PepSY domain-containing protein [Allosphingosinicella sp.]|nr:PepSY domain-containing protein [Allosphingosinicella sp.]